MSINLSILDFKNTKIKFEVETSVDYKSIHIGF